MASGCRSGGRRSLRCCCCSRIALSTDCNRPAAGLQPRRLGPTYSRRVSGNRVPLRAPDGDARLLAAQSLVGRTWVSALIRDLPLNPPEFRRAVDADGDRWTPFPGRKRRSIHSPSPERGTGPRSRSGSTDRGTWRPEFSSRNSDGVTREDRVAHLGGGPLPQRPNRPKIPGRRYDRTVPDDRSTHAVPRRRRIPCVLDRTSCPRAAGGRIGAHDPGQTGGPSPSEPPGSSSRRTHRDRRHAERIVLEPG